MKTDEEDLGASVHADQISMIKEVEEPEDNSKDENMLLDRSGLPLIRSDAIVVDLEDSDAKIETTNCFNFKRGSNMKFNGVDLNVIIDTEKEPIKTVFVHIKQGGLRGFFGFVVINKYFSILRVVLILYTSMYLGMDRYPQSKSDSDFQKVSNIICTVFFICENIALGLGAGWLNFLKEPFFVIDAIVNVVSKIT